MTNTSRPFRFGVQVNGTGTRAEWADQAFERRLINGAERAAFQDRGE